MRILATLSLILFSAAHALAWPGTVVRVVDGDSLIISDQGGTAYRIRLYGIDCPEKSQDAGAEATAKTRLLADGQVVEVEEQHRDRNSRIVAIVALPDGTSLQEELAAAGVAWINERYCRRPECAVWRLLESSARLSGRWIWKSPNPIPPWSWRRGER